MSISLQVGRVAEDIEACTEFDGPSEVNCAGSVVDNVSASGNCEGLLLDFGLLWHVAPRGSTLRVALGCSVVPRCHITEEVCAARISPQEVVSAGNLLQRIKAVAE